MNLSLTPMRNKNEATTKVRALALLRPGFSASRAARQASFAHSQAQRGAALVLLMIMFVVIGTGLLLERANSSTSAEQAARRDRADSVEALKQAKEALLLYATTIATTSDEATLSPGEFPCPDQDRDGWSTLGPDFAGNSCTGLFGWLPYRRLRTNELLDSAGERLWYAVSNTFDVMKAPPFDYERGVDAGLDLDITVNADNDIVAVVIAAHEALSSPDQSSRPAPDSTTHTFDAATDVGYYLESLVTGNPSPHFDTEPTGTGATPVNDQIVYITRAELMAALGERALAEAYSFIKSYRAKYGRFPYLAEFQNPTPFDAGNPLDANSVERYRADFPDTGDPSVVRGHLAIVPAKLDQDDETTWRWFPSRFEVNWVLNTAFSFANGRDDPSGATADNATWFFSTNGWEPKAFCNNAACSDLVVNVDPAATAGDVYEDFRQQVADQLRRGLGYPAGSEPLPGLSEEAKAVVAPMKSSPNCRWSRLEWLECFGTQATPTRYWIRVENALGVGHILEVTRDYERVWIRDDTSVTPPASFGFAAVGEASTEAFYYPDGTPIVPHALQDGRRRAVLFDFVPDGGDPPPPVALDISVVERVDLTPLGVGVPTDSEILRFEVSQGISPAVRLFNEITVSGVYLDVLASVLDPNDPTDPPEIPGDLPRWFIDNGWHRYIVIEYADGLSPHQNGQCVLSTCLEVELAHTKRLAYQPETRSGVEAIVALAGPPLATQNRATLDAATCLAGPPFLCGYFEDVHTTNRPPALGDTHGLLARTTTAFNDLIRIVE